MLPWLGTVRSPVILIKSRWATNNIFFTSAVTWLLYHFWKLIIQIKMKSPLCFLQALETQNLWLLQSAFLGAKVFLNEAFKNLFGYIDIILTVKIITYLRVQIAYISFYSYFGYIDSQTSTFTLLVKLCNCQKLELVICSVNNQKLRFWFGYFCCRSPTHDNRKILPDSLFSRL